MQEHIHNKYSVGWICQIKDKCFAFDNLKLSSECGLRHTHVPYYRPLYCRSALTETEDRQCYGFVIDMSEINLRIRHYIQSSSMYATVLIFMN